MRLLEIEPDVSPADGKPSSKQLGPLAISLLVHISLAAFLLMIGYSVADAPRPEISRTAIRLELSAPVSMVGVSIPETPTREPEPLPTSSPDSPPPPKPERPRSRPRAFQAPRLAASRTTSRPQSKTPQAPRIEVVANAPKPVATQLDTHLAPPSQPPKTIRLGNLTKPELADLAEPSQASLAASGFGDQTSANAPSRDRQPRELVQAGFGSQETATTVESSGTRRGTASPGAFAKQPVSAPASDRSRKLAASGFRSVRVESPSSRREVLSPSASALTPVRILSTPRPAYTDEARDLGLEGEVLLRVQFRASGGLQILEVIQGLGHGLDEAAVDAARQIRFEPAQREGVAVDSSAIVHIVFQLA